MEGLAGEGTALARLTFDFLRPVPIASLALRAEVTRAGAKVLRLQAALVAPDGTPCVQASAVALRDRKSTRLNSSHITISYAVFCLKKKKNLLKYETNPTVN